MAKSKEILPDHDIVRSIFPDLPDLAEDAHTVLTNTFDTCTFRLRLSTPPCPGYPTDLIIRLEKSGNRLQEVAALQKLAQLQLPDLVPETLAVGCTTNADGTDLEYTVIPFVEGSVMLEDVWSDLKPDNQRSLMDAVIGAVESLHQLDTGGIAARQALELLGTNQNTSSGEITIGSTGGGYHVKVLLERLLRNKKTCDITRTDSGLAIRSAYEEVGAIEITQEDLDCLHKSAVFCHNDLEPRNILVRKTRRDQPGRSGGPWFELATIIDWEMAGFYPFSYEFGLKDGSLGISSQYMTWYFLFKERAASLVPEGEAHDKLIRAMWIVSQSNEKAMKKNVGVRVRGKWIERQRLRASSDVRRGWVREEGADDTSTFTKEDNSKLELEVLQELGYM